MQFIFCSHDGVQKFDSHYIQIDDEKLRAFVKKNIQMRDHILIKGMLARRTHIMPDGKKIFSGIIIAKNVWKFHQNTQGEH